jgi:hypothetical protein
MIIDGAKVGELRTTSGFGGLRWVFYVLLPPLPFPGFETDKRGKQKKPLNVTHAIQPLVPIIDSFELEPEADKFGVSLNQDQLHPETNETKTGETEHACCTETGGGILPSPRRIMPILTRVFGHPHMSHSLPIPHSPLQSTSTRPPMPYCDRMARRSHRKSRVGCVQW